MCSHCMIQSMTPGRCGRADGGRMFMPMPSLPCDPTQPASLSAMARVYGREGGEHGIDMEMTDRREFGNPPAFARNQVRPVNYAGRTELKGTSSAAQVRYDSKRANRHSAPKSWRSVGYTICYNRFVRWRKAGVCYRLLAAVSKAFDGEIIMIDSSCVRFHQHAAVAKKGAMTMVAWDVPAAGSPPRSMRLSMPKGGQSISS